MTNTFSANSPCGSKFRLNFQMAECVIASILSVGKNHVGGYTPSAVQTLYSVKEMSMAWFAAYSNSNLISVANQAMSIYKKILKKDASGGYLSSYDNGTCRTLITGIEV